MTKDWGKTCEVPQSRMSMSQKGKTLLVLLTKNEREGEWGKK
jgi:hypothetical protein